MKRGVVAKFGVSPQSIPDYLALVGDTADGFPVRDGAKKLRPSLYLSTRTSKKEWRVWHPSILRARRLSESLFNAWNDALLFRTLATLRRDVPVFDSIQPFRWTGSRPNFEEYCDRLRLPDLVRRAALARSGKSHGKYAF